MGKSCDNGRGRQRARLQCCGQGQQSRWGVKAEGLEAVLVGPAGPFAPGRIAIEHGSGGGHVFHFEVGGRPGCPQGKNTGHNVTTGQHQRPGVGRRIRGGEQLQQRHCWGFKPRLSKLEPGNSASHGQHLFL